MLLSYLKTALRGLLRHRIHAAANIVGLAMGLACSLLVFAYIWHESSYERFNDHGNRVFRVRNGGKIARFPGPTMPVFQDMPEVAQVTRLQHYGGILISSESHRAYHNPAAGDANLFEILDIPFIAGDPASALARPYTMAISERMAKVYFGDEYPLGKTLRWYTSFDIEVTGVYRLPSNSHFQYHFVLSFETVLAERLYAWWKDAGDWNDHFPFQYYVQLIQGVPPTAQFVMESTLQVILAAAIAWLVAITAQPAFSAVTSIELQVAGSGRGQIYWLLFGLATIAVAGATYPAFVLAGFHPTRVFKEASKAGALGAALRCRLVEFQFALSILLVVGTVVVYQQLQMMRTADVGFDKEHVILCGGFYPGTKKHEMAIAQAMSALPSVVAVGRGDRPFQPYLDGSSRDARTARMSEPIGIEVLSAGNHFVSALGMDLLAGREARAGVERFRTGLSLQLHLPRRVFRVPVPKRVTSLSAAELICGDVTVRQCARDVFPGNVFHPAADKGNRRAQSPGGDGAGYTAVAITGLRSTILDRCGDRLASRLYRNGKVALVVPISCRAGRSVVRGGGVRGSVGGGSSDQSASDSGSQGQSGRCAKI